MSTEYSAHPALASEQLQRAEQLAASHSGSAGSSNHFAQHHNRRRHNSTGSGGVTSGSSSSPAKLFKSTTKLNAKHQQQRQQQNQQHQQQQITSNYANAANTEVLSSTATTTIIRPDRRNVIGGDSSFVDSEDINVDFVIAEANQNDDDDYNDNTKDCVDCVPPPPPSIATTTNHNSPLTISSSAAATAAAAASSPSYDETDYLQHRFSRHHHNTPVTTHCSSRQHAADNTNDGCASGLSSTISSPSASTVSSPLSTPTRLAPHYNHHHQHHHQHSQHSQHCCQKATAVGGAGVGAGAGDDGSSAGASSNHPHQHNHHIHHHHNASASTNGGCKKLQKFDPRLSPSPYRQLLPIVLCILSFATVFSILIVYMDTTEIRHQQFRLNMSRDYELYGVAQDDPTLIAFLREIHMRKYPMHFLKNAREPSSPSTSSSLSSASSLSPASPASASSLATAAEQQHLNFSGTHHDGLTPQMAHYVADLVGGKMNGAVIQSLPGAFGHLMTAPWLSETLNWAGVIVEPEPRRYFALRKQNAQRARMQVVHACVSPNPYPKEVTIHNEESEVRINSLLDEETSWFNSRVKCFPLYTIMLACSRVEYDLLSLGVHGHELEILQTLPFDKIKIEVISIHLSDDEQHYENNIGGQHAYIQTITKFLMGKSYRLQKKFGRNYFYQRINTTTSRTRKKDILLLKTP